MEDWSLQAVVGGCNNTDYFNDNSSQFFSPMEFEPYTHNFNDDSTFLLSYTCDNELEDLCKPFYHVFPDQTLVSTHPVDSNEPEEKVDHLLQTHAHATDLVPSSTTPRATKYKKSRKNQQKRVVHQVKQEALSSDVWAWRKYGQKPIKGSPYPRSYYRCSSSKGCLARKQVEQSCSDPSMFIITYTAEHNHSQPIRRNSLAGTNRNKLAASKSTISGKPVTHKPKGSITSMSSIDDEGESTVKQTIIKQETSDEIGDLVAEFNIDDVIFSDNFFDGLEDLDGIGSDSGFYAHSHQQFPATFCS